MELLKSFFGSFNLKEFVGSKKAKAATITIIGIIAGWFSVDLPEDVKGEAALAVLAAVAAISGIYLHAQGRADAGQPKPVEMTELTFSVDDDKPKPVEK